MNERLSSEIVLNRAAGLIKVLKFRRKTPVHADHLPHRMCCAAIRAP